MEPAVILGFAVACVVLNLVPGPGMMFIIAQGIAGGRLAGVISALGMASGTAVHTVAAALGLSALLSAAPAALDVVRIGGALLLLYLAISMVRSTRRPPATPRRGRTYLSAVLTNLANPKVILFYLAFVPQFITAGGWPTGLQILVLGTTLVVIGLVMDSAIGLMAGTFSEFLLRRTAIQNWIKRVSAAILGGLAVRQFLSD